MLKLIKKIFGTPIYVSDIDQFIMAFDKTHPNKSASQQAEIVQYQRIFNLRDNVVETSSKNNTWHNF